MAAALQAATAAPAWLALPIDTYPEAARTQIAAARDAVVSRPDDAARLGELAIVLHAWEQFDLAARAYEAARTLAPRDVTWWALSGALATRTGHHDTAAEYYGRAVALAPSPLLRLRYADALLESGQFAAARRAYDEIVAVPDAAPAAAYGLGRIAAASGDDATARRQFERAVSLDPEFGAAHYALAQLLRKAGDLDGARLAIARQQRCLACWPVPPDPYGERISTARSDGLTLLNRGVSAARRRDAPEAIALHEQALARDAGNVAARVNLISLYAQTGNMAAAEAQYKAVLGAGTDLADAHHAFGLALLDAREPARAQPILELAVRANPLDARAHNGLGFIHELQKRFPDAEAEYRLALAAQPQDRGMRFNLARVIANQGRHDEALAQLTRIAEPDDAESVRYVYAAGAVSVRKGDLAAGRRLSEEALARARKHGLTDLAAAIEKDLVKIR